MSTFSFDSILNEFPKFEKDEVYIWVWNANKIPPHLGLSLGKQYFSLTYKGVDEYAVATMVRRIKRSAIPTLFVGVNQELEADLSLVFQSFERAKPGGATCLSPIKQSLKVSDDIKQLSLLLKALTAEGRIANVFGVFLPNGYSRLPVYSWDDIVSRIEVLNAEK